MVILYVIIYLIKDKQYLKNGKMNNIIIHKDMIMEKQEQCNMLMMEKYLIKMIIMIQILKINKNKQWQCYAHKLEQFLIKYINMNLHYKI